MAVPDLNEESVTADQLPEDGWLQLARELMERGELRLALRASYLAGLAHLGHRELIHLARHKSNRDYDRELHRRARAQRRAARRLRRQSRRLRARLVRRARSDARDARRLLAEPRKDPRMLRKPLLCLLLALLLGGGFAYGLARLFILRYEVGDVYPPYSSLRADPLGTKALDDALDELPDVEVRRNFKPLPRLRPDGPVTLVYTGVPHTRVLDGAASCAPSISSSSAARARSSPSIPVEAPPTAKEDEREEQERAEHEKEEDRGRETPKRRKKKNRGREGRTTRRQTTRKMETNEEAFDQLRRRGEALGFRVRLSAARRRRPTTATPRSSSPAASWSPTSRGTARSYFRDLKP